MYQKNLGKCFCTDNLIKKYKNWHKYYVREVQLWRFPTKGDKMNEIKLALWAGASICGPAFLLHILAATKLISFEKAMYIGPIINAIFWALLV